MPIAILVCYAKIWFPSYASKESYRYVWIDCDGFEYMNISGLEHVKAVTTNKEYSKIIRRINQI